MSIDDDGTYANGKRSIPAKDIRRGMAVELAPSVFWEVVSARHYPSSGHAYVDFVHGHHTRYRALDYVTIESQPDQ